MAGFSISSQSQSLLRPVPAMPGSLRSLESPKTWIRDVQDCCAVVWHGNVGTFSCVCWHQGQPRLLLSYSLIEEKTGSVTGVGTSRVFV